MDLDPTPAPDPERSHDIGPAGLVVVEVTADDVRVRGVDGTVARLVSGHAPEALRIETGDRRLVVRSRVGGPGAFMGIRIGSWGFGTTISGTVELEVPRGSRLEITTASGDVAVRDVQGGVQVRTASGDASLRGVAGDVRFQGASGRLTVVAEAPISLRAETISGDVGVEAPRVDGAQVRTVSGDVEIATTFAPVGAHAIETTSGDVELAVGGGLTLDARTVSGDVDVSHPDRVRGRERRDPIVIGDGSARLTVRTLAGDIDVRRGAPAAKPATPAAPRDDPALDILEALSRGEIDVAEAERRLVAAGSGGPDA